MATRSTQAVPNEAGQPDQVGGTSQDWTGSGLLTGARVRHVPGTGSPWRWFFSGIWLVYLIQPVADRRVRPKEVEALPAGRLGDKRRMIHRVDQFSQAGPPQAVVPGEERLGRSLVGGLPRTDHHRINVTARA